MHRQHLQSDVTKKRAQKSDSAKGSQAGIWRAKLYDDADAPTITPQSLAFQTAFQSSFLKQKEFMRSNNISIEFYKGKQVASHLTKQLLNEPNDNARQEIIKNKLKSYLSLNAFHFDTEKKKEDFKNAFILHCKENLEKGSIKRPREEEDSATPNPAVEEDESPTKRARIDELKEEENEVIMAEIIEDEFAVNPSIDTETANVLISLSDTPVINCDTDISLESLATKYLGITRVGTPTSNELNHSEQMFQASQLQQAQLAYAQMMYFQNIQAQQRYFQQIYYAQQMMQAQLLAQAPFPQPAALPSFQATNAVRFFQPAPTPTVMSPANRPNNAVWSFTDESPSLANASKK